MLGTRWVIVSCAAALVAAACSGDDDGTSTGTTVAPATATVVRPATTSAPDNTAAPSTTGEDLSTTTAVASTQPADALLVETESGAVRGVEGAVAGVRAFLAIPYAAPPVGNNRWRPPQPVEAWDRPLNARRPGAACPQPSGGVVASVTVIPEWDEDCLTLSVWSPENADGLPVMVWIHGGGLTTGSAHQPLYIGDNLAARGVVVVNINYRLGAFGFLDGNYGLADQTAGLEWVAANIAEFGGDPDNVTIFGESAGGSSVCGHLASPASAGLFHKAIIESGGGCDRIQPADQAAAAGDAFIAAAGCDDLACLRALPTRRIIATPFDPALVDDATTLTTTALDQAAAGEPPDVPVLIGSNADEATLFTIGAPEPTEADLLAAAGATGADPPSVLALYPPDQYPTGLARLQAIFSDTRFICPTLEFASAVRSANVYHFTYVAPSNPFGLGATHGAELVFLFAHPEGIRGLDVDIDPASARVSDAIQEAWVSFATDGDPGWPSYGQRGRIMQLDDPLQVVTDIRDGRCATINELTP